MRKTWMASAAIAAANFASAQTQDGNASKGKDLFLKYSCYACHGYSAQNGPGAPLVPMKIAQPAFMAYVRKPPRPNLMPSYSAKALPDSELADIYAYLRTMQDFSKSVPSTPLLNQIPLEQRPPGTDVMTKE